MNQYNASQTLFAQLNQGMSYPLPIPPQFQLTQQLSAPLFDYMNQSKTNSAKSSFPSESLEEPNKRIRLSQQSFTKVDSKVQNPSHSAKASQKANMTIDQSDLTCKDDIYTDSLRQINPLTFGEELIMPSLNILSQDNFQRFSLQAYQKMLQQLEQRKAQYYAQQQLMMYFAKQQIQVRNLNYKLETQHINPKVVQLHQKLKSKDLCELKEHPENINMVIKDEILKGLKTGDTTGMSEANTEEPADENNFEYIQIEKSDDSSSKREAENQTKKVEKNEIESKPSLKNKTQKAKRNKSEEYWNEYSKILGNNIYKKAKEEPRHENKWQSQKRDETSAILRLENTNAIEKSVETAQNQKPAKLAKPIDIPQYMQDDSTIDYENLISMTITNDPAYVSTTEGSTAEFVIINKNTNPSLVQPHNTRVGDKYQVSIPELKGPICGKRRNLKTTWRPEIVKESDLKVYFDELCKIFNCAEINQDQALRLLKSKKYRKEGVTENIGKNRKYYAKILVAPSIDKEVSQCH